MKKQYIRIQIAIVAICIIFQSCKKEIIHPSSSKSMKQLFYTEEGSIYVVRTATKNSVLNVLAGPAGIDINVAINTTTIPLTTDLPIFVSTSKKIIPISLNMAAVSQANVITIDIASVFYTMVSGPGVGSLSYVQGPSQSKMFPLVDRIYYTSNSLYAYNVMYNQIVFSDSDFIDTTPGLGLYYSPDRASAMTGRATPTITLAAGTYDFSTTFVYLELQ